tara:strand:+ start:547 stop:1110 length:564 start_codon:yes stop_codon:yes gene_type:complete
MIHVALVGPQFSGKSCLLDVLCGGNGELATASYITNCSMNIVDFENLTFWDMPGSPRFRLNTCYKRCQIILCCTEISKSGFKDFLEFYQSDHQYRHDKHIWILVGTKSDMSTDSTLSQTYQNWALSNGMKYYETSSGLLSIGVDILLEDLKELGKELENPESIKLFEEYTTPILNYCSINYSLGYLR